MTIKLNHTIVNVRDKRKSAKFFTGLFGLPPAKPFGSYFLTVQLANGSQLLHPDTRADVAKAIFALFHHDKVHALAYASDGTRREPENAGTWLALARIQVGVGQKAQALISYARAKALDSQLPRTPYPP